MNSITGSMVTPNPQTRPAAHVANRSALRLGKVGNGTIPPVSTEPSTNTRTTQNFGSMQNIVILDPPRADSSRLYNAFYNGTSQSQSMDPHSPMSWQDATDSGMPSAGRVEGMTTFGNIDSSDPPELSGTLRRQMAEVEASSVVDSLHAQEVDRALSAAKRRIDRDMQTSTVRLLCADRLPTRALEVYSEAEIIKSSDLIGSAVARFCYQEKSRQPYRAALERHAANDGAERVRVACLALSLPCAELDEHKPLVKELEKRIEAYLKADKGDLHALQDTGGGGGFKQCKAIDEALERFIDAVGKEQIRSDIMAELAPALLNGLEKNGHPVRYESLAAALNPEALGGFLKLTESPKMLLRMADTLPKLLRAAHGAPRQEAPASGPAGPMDPASAFPASAPASNQPPNITVSPVITVNTPPIMVSPSFVNNPGAGERLQAVRVSADEDSEGAATSSHPPARKIPDSISEWVKSTAAARRASASSSGSSSDDESMDDIFPPYTPLVFGTSIGEQVGPTTSTLVHDSNPPPPHLDPELPQNRTQQPASVVVETRADTLRDQEHNPPASKAPTRIIQPQLNSYPQVHVRSYLNDLNPGLRRAGGMGNNTLFQMNVDALRDNIPAGSRVRAERGVVSAEESSKPAKVMPEASNSLPQVTHRGRGAERDGDVRIVPGAMKSSVKRSG